MRRDEAAMLSFRKNVVAGAGDQWCELSQAVELAVALPDVPVHETWASVHKSMRQQLH